LAFSSGVKPVPTSIGSPAMGRNSRYRQIEAGPASMVARLTRALMAS
jgi:hypothetical protein